ncbi:MAG: hypothetical protein JXR95_06920 [Deltaproteobacteria bacterium]|nr:hypothetical protein [Deltaproteobacteria bacterium]
MIYLILVFAGLHLLAFRTVSSENEFFHGNSEPSWIKTGASLAVTILGASAVFGTITLGYLFGIYGIIWIVAGAAGLAVLSLFIGYIKYDGRTFLSSKSGYSVFRYINSLVILSAWTLIIAVQLQVCCALISPYTGSSFFSTVLILITVGTYTVLGGHGSVVKSDIFQLGFMIVAVGMGLILVSKSSGGLEIAGKFNELTEKYSFIAFIPVMFSYLIGPDIHSRLLPLKHSTDRRKAIYFSILLIIPFSVAFALIGWYASNAGVIASPEKIPFILVSMVPESFRWIAVLGLLAALISSIDTTLFTALSISVNQFEIFSFNRRKFFFIFIICIFSGYFSLSKIDIISMMMSAYNIYIGVAGVGIMLFLLGILPEKEWVSSTAITISLVLFIYLKTTGVQFFYLFSMIPSVVIYGVYFIYAKSGKFSQR